MAFRFLCVGSGKASLLGFIPNTVAVTSWIEGYRFGGGAPITFGAVCAFPTSRGIPSVRA